MVVTVFALFVFSLNIRNQTITILEMMDFDPLTIQQYRVLRDFIYSWELYHALVW